MIYYDIRVIIRGWVQKTAVNNNMPGLQEMRDGMKVFEKYKKELKAFETGKGSYEWDELEELITNDFEEERLSSEEFDSLMQQLMELEPE